MNGLLATVNAISKFKGNLSPVNAGKRRGREVDAETTWMWRILQDDPIDIDQIEELIEAKEADVNMKDKIFGWSPIHFASNTGQAALIKMLMDAKASTAEVDNEGNSPLIFASRRGHIDAVEFLVGKKANLNLRNNNGWSALCWAAINGHDEIATTLLAAMADYNLTDNNGRTACMWAARHGYLDIVEALLVCGINLGAQDEAGLTAMDHATEHKELRAAMLAAEEVNRGLLDSAKRGDQVGIEEAIQKGANLETRTEDGWTPLMWSALLGKLDLVEVLVRHGANPSLLDDKGESIAALSDQYQAVGDALGGILGANGRMLKAAKDDKWNTVEQELRIGAWVNVKDDDKRTALMWSCRFGRQEPLASLVSKGAHMDERDNFGWTGLLFAVWSRNYQTVSALYYHGANFFIKSYDGDSAMHVAARAEDGVMIQLLLAANIDIEEENVEKNTPLQVAALTGLPNAMRTLIVCGANAAIKDRHERSPFCMAVVQGHLAVVQAMLEPLKKPPLMPAVGEGLGVDDTSGRQTSKSSKKKAESDQKTQKAKKEAPPEVKTENSTAELVASPTPSKDRPKKNASAAEVKDPGAKQMPRKTMKASFNSNELQAMKLSANSNDLKSRSLTASKSSNSESLKTMRNAVKDEGMQVKRSKSSKLANVNAAAAPKAESVLSLFYLADDKRKEFSKSLPTLGKKLLNEVDESGRAALALAVVYNRQDMVPLLIMQKADVNASNAEGFTVLMEAVVYRRLHIVDMLLSAGSRTDVRNKEGHRAVDLAEDPAIRELLDKYEINRALPPTPTAGAGGAAGGGLDGPGGGTDGSPGRIDNHRRGSKIRPVFRIRIENLPTQLTSDILEEHIRSLMRRLGAANPTKVDVAVDPISAKPRGYAYVNFADAAAADLMLRGNGEQIGGSKLRIYRDSGSSQQPAAVKSVSSAPL